MIRLTASTPGAAPRGPRCRAISSLHHESPGQDHDPAGASLVWEGPQGRRAHSMPDGCGNEPGPAPG